jgi:hypothetical protein
MASTKTPLALLVQLESRAGSGYRAVARVVRPQESGELHNVSWSGRYGEYGEDAARFEGLEISAYAGNSSWSADQSDEYKRLWGFGVHYTPYRVEDAAHASAIARTFGQLERGMVKLAESDGYIRDGEFSRYVMRVAKALRIPRVYVRTHPRAFNMTGERYRTVDALSLAYWESDVVDSIVKGELASLVK